MVRYACWIAGQRAAALARGGKSLRIFPPRPGVYAPDFPYTSQRRRGEIINPLTGEIVTGCLTIPRFAKELGLSSHALGKLLQAAECADLVLCTRDVPMACAAGQYKPQYYHTPRASQRGIAEGWVIPLPDKMGRPFILITTLGQERIKAALAAQTPEHGRVEARRQLVCGLLGNGLSQAEISRQTGIPKQTVSRIARSLR